MSDRQSNRLWGEAIISLVKSIELLDNASTVEEAEAATDEERAIARQARDSLTELTRIANKLLKVPTTSSSAPTSPRN
jgi:hypothetical protein